MKMKEEGIKEKKVKEGEIRKRGKKTVKIILTNALPYLKAFTSSFKSFITFIYTYKLNFKSGIYNGMSVASCYQVI